MRLPRRVPAIPVQQRLSLSAASRTASRDAHHGARRASKRAPRAGGLCGTVAEITGVPERRDKRTRLVHDSGGKRGVNLTPEKEKKDDIEGDGGTVVLLVSSDAG